MPTPKTALVAAMEVAVAVATKLNFGLTYYYGKSDLMVANCCQLVFGISFGE